MRVFEAVPHRLTVMEAFHLRAGIDRAHMSRACQAMQVWPLHIYYKVFIPYHVITNM